jgi:cyclohexa-1,5-dienecarbonyl-CoA hydratase
MSLEVRERDGVCELHIDAPPGNVMHRDLCAAMTNAVRERGDHVKAFLFTAAGKNFSYGASVPQHVAGEVEKFLPAFHDLFFALVESGVPTVAAVRGLCLGGAFELTAFASHLIAERGARFAVPEITLGVIPPVACAILPWRLGGALTDEMILGGGMKRAEEGIAHEVCEPGELEAATEKYLDENIRPRSGPVLRLAVRTARAPLHDAIRGRLRELERIYLDELMALPDAHEGIAAFLEKRQPNWAEVAVR